MGESVLEIPETTETVVERPFQRPVPVLLGIDGDGRVFRDPNGAPNLYGLDGRPIHLADRADHLPAPLPQFPIKTVEIEDQLEPHFRTVLAIIHMDLVDAGAMLPPVATWTIIAGEQPEQKFGHEHRVPFVARVLVEPDRLVARGFPPDPFPAAIRYGGDGVRPVLVDQIQRPPVPRVDSRADAFEIPVLQDVPPHGIHVFRDELRRRRRRRGRVERVTDDVEHVPIAHGDPVGFRGLPGAWREEQETVPVTGEFPLYLIVVSGWIGNGVLNNSLEDESLFGEFLRAPISEGGVEPLVVEPPHVVVEVAPQLLDRGVVVPVYELLLQQAVGGFDHRVVVRVALARQ